MKLSIINSIGLTVTTALMLLSCSEAKNGTTYAEEVKDLDDLVGKKVAVLSGTIQDLKLSEMDPSPEILRFASLTENLAALENGKADYSLDDTTSIIGAHIENRGMQIAFSSKEVAGFYGFAMNKENLKLQGELNAFLDSLKSSGELDRIVAKWTIGDIESVVMPDIPTDPKGETLRVGTTSLFPFTFIQNGKNAGLEIEILTKFASQTGRNISFYDIDFSGLIAALVSGKIDLISSSMTITEERSKQVTFSTPYYECGSICLCRSSDFQVQKEGFFSRIKTSFINNLILEKRWKLILDGLWETLVISIFSILLGALFGCLICWMRMSHSKMLRGTATVFVDIIRGVPILVLLMIMFYVVFKSGGLSPRWVAITAFAITFGAYVSEMYRTGIEGVERGQTEAGLAMGFTPFKTFFLFIVPQAAKNVIPVFKGEAVSLFKNTSVVGFIAIQDLTKASEIIRSRTFDAFFPLILISIIYFVLAWILGKLLDCLAQKFA